MTHFSSTKNLLLGILIGIMLTAGLTALAASQILSAEYNQVSVSIDGIALELSTPLISVIDAETPNAASNYMPLRAILSALGYEVAWDGATQNIDLSKKAEDLEEPEASLNSPAPEPTTGSDLLPDPNEPELPEIRDMTGRVEFADFSFLLNGEEVTKETLADVPIYRITASTINNAGTAAEAIYNGYKLADVLSACGLEGIQSVTAVANDGFKKTFDGEQIQSNHLLVAIEKDRATGVDGTIWLAPCTSQTSGDYVKLVVELIAE